MKLVVIDFMRELSHSGYTSNFKGQSLIEAPFRVQERELDADIHAKINAIIKYRYGGYVGEFVYVISSGKRNSLILSACQKLDGKSVYTIKSKSTNNLYVMLTKPAAGGNLEEQEDDEEEEEVVENL